MKMHPYEVKAGVQVSWLSIDIILTLESGDKEDNGTQFQVVG